MTPIFRITAQTFSRHVYIDVMMRIFMKWFKIVLIFSETLIKVGLVVVVVIVVDNSNEVFTVVLMGMDLLAEALFLVPKIPSRHLHSRKLHNQ